MNAENLSISDEELRGDETIFIVEDEVFLLEMAQLSLEDYGYKVLTAPGPQEAIRFCETYHGKIDLLLTDVIMPVMNGRELSEKIVAMRPDIKTLFMSGYAADTLFPHGTRDKRVELLQKPFAPWELAKKVRHVLSRKL